LLLVVNDEHLLGQVWMRGCSFGYGLSHTPVLDASDLAWWTSVVLVLNEVWQRRIVGCWIMCGRRAGEIECSVGDRCLSTRLRDTGRGPSYRRSLFDRDHAIAAFARRTRWSAASR
jgi:hypothetical protein